jgi:phosphate starvation-inducible protein PhoH and related proteins
MNQKPSKGSTSKPKTTTVSTSEKVKNKTIKEIICSVIKKKTRQKFLTENQKKYYDSLIENEISICSGPAGTGKSYISMKAAIDLISDPETPYEKIMIVRPAVESSSSPLGSLPGDLRDKMGPYVYSSLSLLHKIIGKENTEKLEQSGVLEIMSLSFLRGYNADNMILIFEESQNSTPSEMKMLLTRIGFNSKFFISGDIEQSDKFKKKELSGLYDAIQRLKDIENIGLFEFNDNDVVRNPLIKKIIKRYND